MKNTVLFLLFYISCLPAVFAQTNNTEIETLNKQLKIAKEQTEKAIQAQKNAEERYAIQNTEMETLKKQLETAKLQIQEAAIQHESALKSSNIANNFKKIAEQKLQEAMLEIDKLKQEIQQLKANKKK